MLLRLVVFPFRLSAVVFSRPSAAALFSRATLTKENPTAQNKNQNRQHDAPINPGSSGGPLLDTGGCFVGTNTAILSPSGASAGVGFAIPADLVASSVRQILETGRVVRPVLGLSFAPDSSAEQLGVRGILVLSAREGGPAWRAGVRGTERDGYGRLVLGDIVVAVDGAPVRSSSDLYAALDRSSVGSEMELTLLRGSETVAVSATLDPSS
jgi:S1-C subfamily serine protease